MADEWGSGGEQKTLEMRVAELEDKLSQLHITEDEMQTYHKVASRLGAAQPCQQCAAAPPCVAHQAAAQPCQQCAAAPPPCVAQQAAQPCIAQQSSPYFCYLYCYGYCIRCIRPIYYADCIGPCVLGSGGGGTGGGGFGGFGT
jgi:hypothetical protein